MAISKIPSAGFQDNVKFRNLIINGSMDIAQRATSVAGVVSGGYRVHDRWRGGGTIPGTWTWSQSTDVPSGQGFSSSMKWDCTTADASLSANDTFAIQQRIEAQNLQYLKKGTSSAESVTLSFWVKSNKTGTYICELEDSDNTRHISKSYTINSANTWEKKTITYEGDTTGTLNNDNGTGFQLQFWLAAGTDSTSGTLQTTWAAEVQANTAVGQVNLADSTANEWLITGVQLESGSASDFEFLPRGIMESLCQRYYQDYTDYNIYLMGKGYGASTSGLRQPYSLKTTMRASPTTVVSNTSNGGSATNFAINNTTPNWVSFNLTSSNGSNVSMYQRFKFTADSEL